MLLRSMQSYCHNDFLKDKHKTTESSATPSSFSLVLFPSLYLYLSPFFPPLPPSLPLPVSVRLALSSLPLLPHSLSLPVPYCLRLSLTICFCLSLTPCLCLSLTLCLRLFLTVCLCLSLTSCLCLSLPPVSPRLLLFVSVFPSLSLISSPSLTVSACPSFPVSACSSLIVSSVSSSQSLSASPSFPVSAFPLLPVSASPSFYSSLYLFLFLKSITVCLSVISSHRVSACPSLSLPLSLSNTTTPEVAVPTGCRWQEEEGCFHSKKKSQEAWTSKADPGKTKVAAPRGEKVSVSLPCLRYQPH